MLYAIDSDDVLFILNDTLQSYKVKQDRSKGVMDTKVLKTEEIFDYNLGRVWGCSLEEAFGIVDDFFNSEEFFNMRPVPGAQRAIGELKEEGHDLIVLTSRPEWMQQKTLEQIASYYPGRFDDVLFSGEWSKNPNGNSKGVICKDLGVKRLVDDRFKYCNDTSQHGIKSYLFDLDGNYAWNKKSGLILPTNITRVKSWEEIMEKERVNSPKMV